MYVQINIGRNVNDEPMPDDVWEGFINHVVTELVYSANGVHDRFISVVNSVEIHRGRGVWDGVPEDSAHISLYWGEGFNVYYLRKQLADVRDLYQQKSIALILGSELI